VPAADAPAAAADAARTGGAGGGEEGNKPGFLDRLLGPKFREVTVPAGTPLSLSLLTAVSSDDSRVEDTVRARVTKPVVINGTTVIPEGAEAVGTVLEADDSGRVKGRASVAFRFNRLNMRNESLDIRTARIARVAPATKGEDATKIAIGAGAGAVIGAIAGGKTAAPGTPLWVGGFGSKHPGGAQFAMGDGSVRTLANSTSGTILSLLARRDDGQALPNF
jgi:prepilin-type processing-associated H-X9-DG protein